MSRAHWELDFDALACRDCGKSFTFLLRRHHCRSCGLIFCGVCSPSRAGSGRLAGSRACSACWNKAVSDAAFESSRAATARAAKERARVNVGDGGGGGANASFAQSPLKTSAAADAAAKLLTASVADEAGEKEASRDRRSLAHAQASSRAPKESSGVSKYLRTSADTRRVEAKTDVGTGAAGGRASATRFAPAPIALNETAGASASLADAERPASPIDDGRAAQASTPKVSSLSLRRTAIALLRLADGVASDARPHERAVTPSELGAIDESQHAAVAAAKRSAHIDPFGLADSLT